MLPLARAAAMSTGLRVQLRVLCEARRVPARTAGGGDGGGQSRHAQRRHIEGSEPAGVVVTLGVAFSRFMTRFFRSHLPELGKISVTYPQAG